MNITFYDRVKTLTKKQGKNVKQLLEELNINGNTYTSQRAYGNLPRAEDALAIAQALNTTVELLVTGKEPEQNAKYEKLKKIVQQALDDN